MNNYMVYDLETGSNEVFNRVANYKFNEIVCFSIKTKDLHLTEYVKDKYAEQKIVSFIEKAQTVVAFNAKFDVLYIYNEDGFQDWLKKGGQIFCPQLAEYILSGYYNQYPALRKIAVDKYHRPFREKGIDPYLKKGIHTSDIPEDIVYNDNHEDVIDTEVIYLEQQREIERRGPVFQNLITTQMDFLLATIEIENNGMFINQKVLKENQAELEAELHDVETELNELIKTYWR